MGWVEHLRNPSACCATRAHLRDPLVPPNPTDLRLKGGCGHAQVNRLRVDVKIFPSAQDFVGVFPFPDVSNRQTLRRLTTTLSKFS